MIASFPFKNTDYWISQPFGTASSAYISGFHLGVDIVPTQNGTFWPAPVYAILPGTLRYFYESLNDKNSKAIAVDTWLDVDFVSYLKSIGKIPVAYNAKVRLMHTYLHGLEILDKDGTIDQDIPIMKCGNTGMVYSGGAPVPEEDKGVPPYKGGHLHLECQLLREDNIPFGHIDPMLIINKENNKVIYKQVGKPTLYFAVGSILIPFATDYASYLAEFAQAVILDLPDSEFVKFKVASELKVKK